MEFNKVAGTGRDNIPHAKPIAPSERSYAKADLEGSGGSDGRAQTAREQYSDERLTPGTLVDHHISAVLHAH
jgi:hypothetical protein